jgi:hypothetical protein
LAGRVPEKQAIYPPDDSRLFLAGVAFTLRALSSIIYLNTILTVFLRENGFFVNCITTQ